MLITQGIQELAEAHSRQGEICRDEAKAQAVGNEQASVQRDSSVNRLQDFRRFVATVASEEGKAHRKPPSPKEMSWDEVREGGAYVFTDVGYLARVPDCAVAQGRSPTVTLNFGAKGPTVRKLSDDPYIPISKARQLAAEHGCQANF